MDIVTELLAASLGWAETLGVGIDAKVLDPSPCCRSQGVYQGSGNPSIAKPPSHTHQTNNWDRTIVTYPCAARNQERLQGAAVNA